MTTRDYELIGLDFADLELRCFAHLHERTMTKPFEYATLAQRTCPDSYHVTAVPPGLLMSSMMNAINALAALDVIKKAYAYGKPLPAALKPLADATDGTVFAGELDGHIVHAILGIATEGGELLEAAVKTLFNGEAFDIVNFQEELGDVAWYRAIGLNAVGQPIIENDKQNIEKLLARFPDKFDANLAINRDTAAERRVLEGEDFAEDLGDVEIIAHGPDHNRLRWTDDEGTVRLSTRLVLMPFRAAHEYNGKYKGQLLATDDTTLYRINGTVTDNSAYPAEPADAGSA